MPSSPTHVMVPLDPPPGSRFMIHLHQVHFECERSKLTEAVEWLAVWVNEVLTPMARMEAERRSAWKALEAKEEEELTQKKLNDLMAQIPDTPAFADTRSSIEKIRAQIKPISTGEVPDLKVDHSDK